MEKPHNRDKCAKCAAKAVWVGYCRTCAREILHALGNERILINAPLTHGRGRGYRFDLIEHDDI